MLNSDILLNKDILIELPEGTAYNKKLFKGLYLKNYRLKDFLLNNNIGYEKYMLMVWSIVRVPKDIADQLWVEHRIYYKDIDEWTLTLSDNIYCINNQMDDSQTILMQALRHFFGYNFALRIKSTGNTSEEKCVIDMLDDEGNWLLTINKDVFSKIRDMVKLVNNIRATELSLWGDFKYKRHEQIALEQYYKKRKYNDEKEKSYIFSIETILYFLEAVSRISFEELLNRSLHNVYMSFESVTNTLRALSLNIGIYGGNIKIDNSITNRLIYGAIYNKVDTKRNLITEKVNEK